MTSVGPSFGPFRIHFSIPSVGRVSCLFAKFINILGWMFRRNFHAKFNLQIWLSAEISSAAWNCVCLAIIVIFCLFHSRFFRLKSLWLRMEKKVPCFGLSRECFHFSRLVDHFVISSLQTWFVNWNGQCMAAVRNGADACSSITNAMWWDELGCGTKNRENDKRCIRRSNHNHVFNRQWRREMRGCEVFSRIFGLHQC